MYLLSGGPFILLGLIALDSRLSPSDWKFVEYGFETSQRIYAYQQPVTLALEIEKGDTSDKQLEYTMALWLDAYRSGLLKDIAPATALMDGTSGPYLQVLAAKHGLIDSAIDYSTMLEKQGKKSKAAKILVQALELSEVGKYSDFSSYSRASVKQTRILKKLVAAVPSLSSEDQAEATHEMIAILNSSKSIDDVMDNVAAAYRTDLQRSGEKAIDLLVVGGTERLASNDIRLENRFKDLQKLATTRPEMISLYGKSRIAYLQYKELSSAATIARLTLDPLTIN